MKNDKHRKYHVDFILETEGDENAGHVQEAIETAIQNEISRQWKNSNKRFGIRFIAATRFDVNPEDP